MVVLIAFQHEQPAQLLANFLRTKNIDAIYAKDAGNFPHSVLLKDPSQLSQAKIIAEDFLSKPTDNKYQQAAWSQGEATKLQTGSSLFGNLKPIDLQSIPFTSLVIFVCLIVYAASMFGWFNFVFHWLQIRPFPELLESNEWWRLVGPAFVHFSGLHIIFNLIWWWSLGGKIEQKFGTSALVTLFLVSAIASNVGQLIEAGPYFGGLSGVVYAVVGFVWWIGWLKPSWGLSLPKPVVGFLLIWLILGYADMLWVNMANTAHTVGLLTGCLGAWLLSRLSSDEQKSNRLDKDT